MELEQRGLRKRENSWGSRRFDKIREMRFGMYWTARNLRDYYLQTLEWKIEYEGRKWKEGK